jgi:hypothetical protein
LYAILRIPKNRRTRENPQIMKKMILKTLRSFNINLRNSTNHAHPLRGSLLIPLLIGCFAFLPRAQAAPEKVTATPDAMVNPHRQVLRMPAAPELALAGFNTADGDHALFSITTGIANTAVGWYSLFANTDGSWNTAVGAGTLVLNIGDQTTGEGLENTAVGAAALLFNTTGSNNTALGVLALENNTSGGGSTAVGIGALQQNTGVGSSTAVGFDALINNIDGFNNAAFGIRPLEFNTSGTNNTAIGNLALNANTTNSNHVCVGRLAGSGITTVDNNIILGHHNGVHSVFGQVSDRCFIDNISGSPVSAGTAAFVLVDSDGRLGTFTVAGPDPGGFSPQPAQRISPQGAKQATLNLKVEKLQATVTEQKKQIESLTAQLKQQAAQIQKVSAQLEVRKPATKVVSHKQ